VSIAPEERGSHQSCGQKRASKRPLAKRSVVAPTLVEQPGRCSPRPHNEHVVDIVPFPRSGTRPTTWKRGARLITCLAALRAPRSHRGSKRTFGKRHRATEMQEHACAAARSLNSRKVVIVASSAVTVYLTTKACKACRYGSSLCGRYRQIGSNGQNQDKHLRGTCVSTPALS
jgi:hypothetical protein